MNLPIALSNRHIHLSLDDIDTLFGKGHVLVEFKPLSQPGQYACEEKLDLVGPKGTIKGVRVLGPARKQTQIEISLTDGFSLGIKAPLRNSGDLAGSAGTKLIGPKGEIDLNEGVIVAARHIHMSDIDAERYGYKDKQIVKVKTSGDRGVIFKNVLLRVSGDYITEMHVDMDEGNAAAVKNGDIIEIIND